MGDIASPHVPKRGDGNSNETEANMETKTIATRVERSIAATLAKWADERELLMSELLRYHNRVSERRV